MGEPGRAADARRHVASAELLLESDPNLAFVALHDAMRKSISARMRSRGLRVTCGPGQHVKVGAYARAALDHLGIDVHLAEFDEYGALWVKPGDVSRAVTHVAAIIEAVHADLGAEPSTP